MIELRTYERMRSAAVFEPAAIMLAGRNDLALAGLRLINP